MNVQIEPIISEIEKVVLSKPLQVRLCVAALLANGHVLLEDLPGMGKTTLATALAQVFALPFNRLQMTSDVLPLMCWVVIYLMPNLEI